MATILHLRYDPRPAPMSLTEKARAILEKRSSQEIITIHDPALMLEIERVNAAEVECKLSVAFGPSSDVPDEAFYSYGRGLSAELTEIVKKDAAILVPKSTEARNARLFATLYCAGTNLQNILAYCENEKTKSIVQELAETINAALADHIGDANQMIAPHPDTVRLDALAKHALIVRGDCDRCSESHYKIRIETGHDYYEGGADLPLREAIDAMTRGPA